MHYRRLAQAALTFLLSATSVSSLSVERRATVCNGHAEFCERSYGNVTVVGAHNSYTNSPTNLAANQEQDVSQQLKDGIRMLQNQAHRQDDGIHLCHSTCVLYDGGLLTDYLAKVKTFMDANPEEVVTILLVNIDNLPATAFAAAYEAAGLVDMSYAPPAATVPLTGWPTLGSMIDSGKRLVTFIDNQASFETVPYLIDEFSNMWETAFDVTAQDFPCTVNRTAGDPATQLMTINHFLYEYITVVGTTSLAPAKDQLEVTNAASGFGSLGQEADTCAALHGRYPNFMLVDFYNYGSGSVFEVAARINGVEYNPSTPVPAPNPSGTSGGSATGRPSGSAGNSATLDFPIRSGLAAVVGFFAGVWIVLA